MATQSSSLLFLLLTLLIPSFLTILPFGAQASGVKSSYWLSDSGFPASSIDATLFTHLFCAFASLNGTTYELSITPSISSFTATVQLSNPSVKTLLSIGGGTSSTTDFAAMASSATSRSTFIQSSISLARANGFSGLDLDWEYPQTTQEMNDFGTLLSEWRTAVDTESTTSGNTALLLTAAVYFNQTITWPQVRGYPVDAMSASLDWLNMMDYDYHAPSNSPTSTAAHAALYDPASSINTNSGVGYWVGSGLQASKLALGLPYYGYAWTLTNPNQHGLGAPAAGKASPPGADDSGAISYSNIRAFIQQTGAPVVYDSTVVVNYCYSGTTWIGYDDVDSIQTKVSYAKQNGLLGYFSWSVGADNNWNLSQAASTTWG